MGRLVRAPITVPAAHARPRDLAVGEGEMQAGEAGAAQEEKGGDGYLERVAKYVPAEIVGFFLFVNNILDQALKSATDGKPATMAGLLVSDIGVAVFVIALVLTPLYVIYQRERGDAWIIHAIVSTFAFPVWAYAMHAVAFGSHYDGNFASILLATFTVASGLVAPPAQKPADNGEPHVENPPNPNPSPDPDPNPNPDPVDPAVPPPVPPVAEGDPARQPDQPKQ